jgi:hypothetical protein
MECHRPWYLTVQKNNAKETLRETFARMIAMQDRLNPTPRGSPELKWGVSHKMINSLSAMDGHDRPLKN